MSDSWMQLIASAILAWGAWEIRALRGEFKRYVLRDDCQKDMSHHCNKIASIERTMNEQRERLTRLESKAAVWHEND